MTVFSRHPVDSPVITQPWGANRTGGIIPDPNGTDMQRIVATYGNYQPHGHDGIDYGCPIGTPVYAPGDGVIDYAGWGQDMPQWVADKYASVAGPGGWPSGIITFLDHGPIGSYVAHKSESYMDNRVGERIAAGTLLGLSGTTGRSGGPHVHFSAIRFPVNYSDPLYSRVNPLDHFSTVTLTPIRPGATGDPGTATKPLPEGPFMALTDAQQDQLIKDAKGALAEAGGARRTAQVALKESENAKSYALQSLAILKALAKRDGLTDADLERIGETVRQEIADTAIDVNLTINGKDAA